MTFEDAKEIMQDQNNPRCPDCKEPMVKHDGGYACMNTTCILYYDPNCPDPDAEYEMRRDMERDYEEACARHAEQGNRDIMGNC